MSQREIDPNGWMYIKKNPISKSGVFPYLGSEIGAPEPTRIYNVLRPPEELEKAAETFRLIPIIDEHELLGSIGTSTDDRTPAGTTGETVTYEHPYLYSSIKITSDALQKQLARGKIELSPAYTCDWVEQSGIYEGEQYDYVQKINHGNHLALVEKGRTGRDVAVLDHYAFDTGGLLPMTLEELLAAIGALSDEDKAKLQAALSPATDEEKDETATDDEVTDIVEETDAVAEAAAEAVAAEERGDDVAAIEAAGEAVENAEQVLEATEELQDKIAQDAMHKAVKHIDERNAMAARVKPFIGAVPAAAMDSAETIAAYACKKFGVKHGKGQATAVITGYLHGRKPASEKSVAQDKAVVSTHKPNASVFGWEK